jgi:hypothetical protein
VLRDTPVYERPNSGSRRIVTLRKGATVQALTGFVRTRAGRFNVSKDHGRFKAGDTLWAYTYHGEGMFTVWYKGAMSQEQLDFSPYNDGAYGLGSGSGWGRLDKRLQSTWWVKMRLKGGRVAWTYHRNDYGNRDACG